MLFATALLVRTFSAAVIAVAAAGKVARLPASAVMMWRPARVTPRVTVVLVTLWATLELALAFLVVLAPAPVAPIAAAVVAFFLIVTIYGTVSIARSGQCGCGAGAHGSTLKNLWLRNTALLAACLLGLLLGPSLDELSDGAPGVFLSLALLPTTFIALALLRRLGAERTFCSPSAVHRANQMESPRPLADVARFLP